MITGKSYRRDFGTPLIRYLRWSLLTLKKSSTLLVSETSLVTVVLPLIFAFPHDADRVVTLEAEKKCTRQRVRQEVARALTQATVPPSNYPLSSDDFM